MDHSKHAPRRWLVIALATAALGLSACVGVLDRCADGLNPPAGGWEPHGPG